MTPSHDAHQATLAEKAEAEYFRRFLLGAPESVREELGIRTARIGGGVVTAMRKDPSGYWTKALGFGPGDTVDAATVREIVDFFRSSGKDAGIIALAPAAEPPDWAAIRRRFGLVPASKWAKFARLTGPIDDRPTGLAVRALTDEDAPAWQRVVREAFGMLEPDLTPMLRGTIADPDARVFGAFDGDLLVGAGALHLVGDAASLNTGGTLPSHRRRGVQYALLVARVRAAAEAGCRLVSAETGAAPDDTSYRNLVRAGFGHLYDRTNWQWQAGAPGASGAQPGSEALA
ncbi:GNAT family N-acetyltransferase [Subtercola sp. Z020]|uniref:GNAT family N-acetyltransferase n=1 Tax=Subtercola sp. Z020 TaxID=2080582 RepID=UPI000CE759FC|nr:GNAT family N-acetyltransferase [Subtercola sp. Z020]PPF77516.1 GNAT family N-acetyltransferase [Subtercola sp. Z020]